MVTVSAATSGPEPEPLHLIDMSKLTQSELQTLSFSSSSNLPHRNLSSDQLFFPAIDRSIFNESAGSRRQTYSRPDSSPSAAGHHHRNRLAGLLPTAKLPPADDDPVRRENIAIIKTLSHYIGQNANPNLFSHIDLTPPSLPAPLGLDRERKRKRGRRPKVSVNVPVEGHQFENVGTLEIKNKNGVEVDIDALSGLVDPYAVELRRRTEGLVTEEELLGFLRDLGGEWGSRRKKRKIVDAGIFGDLLPVGWKLLLGLRRREGQVSVYCRRYVSPNGQQFLSCKEISSYLRSYSRLADAWEPKVQNKNYILQESKVTSESHHAGVTHKDDGQNPALIGHSNGAISSSSLAFDKEVKMLDVGNPAEVQIHDVFECHKCNMTFAKKDTYLQHLLSFHQRHTRKYRLGSSVGDGVIMKDGKFECQFCHKVFEERRRYNGHVGIHVRNYMRRTEESPSQGNVLNKLESSSRNDLPSRISKMDALIEIAQSSILETSNNGEHGGLDGIPASEKTNDMSVESSSGTSKGDDGKLDSLGKLDDINVESSSYAIKEDDMKLDSSVSELKTKKTEHEITPDEEVTDKNSDPVITDLKVELSDPNNVSEVNIDTKFDERSASVMDNQNGKVSAMPADTVRQTFMLNDIVRSGIDNEAPEYAIPSLRDNMVATNHPKCLDSIGKTSEIVNESIAGAQPHDDVIQTCQQSSNKSFDQRSIPDSVSKGENHCTVDRRDMNMEAFEELRYDGIEPMEFAFVTTQESLPMPDEQIHLDRSAAIDGQYDSSVQFGSEVVTDMVASHLPTTVCVWCGVVFSHDDVESELQTDSVGFMCPTCKVKISGEFAVLDGGSPTNTNCF